MPQTKKMELNAQHDPQTIWGEMGHDEYVLVSSSGIKIVDAKIKGRTLDPGNNNVVVADTHVKHGPAPNQITVNWWRNAGFKLQYKLEVTYETSGSTAPMVKFRKILAPLLNRKHGLAPVSFTQSGGAYYPDHFSVEAPSSALVDSVLILTGNPLTTEEVDLTLDGSATHLLCNVVTKIAGQPRFFGAWCLSPSAGALPEKINALIEWSLPPQ